MDNNPSDYMLRSIAKENVLVAVGLTFIFTVIISGFLFTAHINRVETTEREQNTVRSYTVNGLTKDAVMVNIEVLIKGGELDTIHVRHHTRSLLSHYMYDDLEQFAKAYYDHFPALLSLPVNVEQLHIKTLDEVK